MQEFQLGYLYKKWEKELCSERIKNESTQTKLGILLPKDSQDAKRKAIKHFQKAHEALDKLKDWQETANVSIFGKYLAKKHESNLTSVLDPDQDCKILQSQVSELESAYKVICEKRNFGHIPRVQGEDISFLTIIIDSSRTLYKKIQKLH